MKEGNEGCDCGTSLTGPWPTGCNGPNGLFFGDASGCSKTCTKEPTCRTGATTQACAVSCGNGAIETGRGLRRRQPRSGRRLLVDLHARSRLHVRRRSRRTTRRTCTETGNTGKCLQLPIIYRDFKSEKESGGHPDFFYLGATGREPGQHHRAYRARPARPPSTSATAFPNSSGPAKKNDATNRCWDLASATLGANGKPTFNTARTGGTNCDCQFIDWSHDTNGGHVPGYAMAQSPTIGLTYTDGASGHPMYRGPAPIVTSATHVRPVVGRQHVHRQHAHRRHPGDASRSAAGQYQYSSQVNSVTGGFFPLDPPAHGFPLYTMAPAGPGTPPHMVGTEAMLCNLWPYWHSSAAFGAGNNCRGDQYLFPPSLIPPTRRRPARAGMNCTGKWYVGQQGWFHDSWFTDEARYLFTYDGDFTLQFYGDDDMFIFINGILVVDLGGVHQRLPGRVDVDGRDRHGDNHRGRLARHRRTRPSSRARRPIRTPA